MTRPGPMIARVEVTEQAKEAYKGQYTTLQIHQWPGIGIAEIIFHDNHRAERKA